jgi:hypothetical protein
MAPSPIERLRFQHLPFRLRRAGRQTASRSKSLPAVPKKNAATFSGRRKFELSDRPNTNNRSALTFDELPARRRRRQRPVNPDQQFVAGVFPVDPIRKNKIQLRIVLFNT